MLVFLIFLVTSSQNLFFKSKSIYTYLPQDAQTVACLNLEALWEKGKFESFQNEVYYRDLIQKIGKQFPDLIDVLEDPFNSGLNLNNHIYYFAEQIDESMVNGLVFETYHLKKLNHFISSINKNDILQSESGKILLINDRQAILWNQDVCILVDKNKGVFSAEDLEKYLATDLSFNRDQFSHESLFKQNQKDLVIVNSLKAIESSETVLKILDLFEREFQFDKNHIVSTLSFDRGVINGHSKFIFDQNFSRFFEATLDQKVRRSNIPTEALPDLDFEASGTLSIKNIKSWLDIDLLSKKVFQDYDLTTGQLIEVLAGQFLYGQYISTRHSKQDFIQLEIGDTIMLETVLDILEEKDLVSRKAANYYEMNSFKLNRWLDRQYPKSNLFIKGHLYIENGFLIYAENEVFLSEIIKNKSNRKAEFNEENASVNIKFSDKFLNSSTLLSKVNSEESELEISKEGINFSIKMKNENENSLKALLDLFNKNYLRNKIEYRQAAEDHSI